MKKILQSAALCVFVLGLATSCENPVVEPTPALNAPTELKAEPLSTTTAQLSWAAVEDADAYNIQVGERAAVKITGATTYRVTGLTANTTYTWKVQALNGEVESEWTTGPQFTTLAEDPPTPVPTGLTATEVTQNAALLSWQHDNADKHELLISGGNTVSLTGLSYNATGLTPSTAYTWRVRSSKDNLWSEWVDGPGFTTEAKQIIAPDGLVIASLTFNGAVVRWNVPSDFTTNEGYSFKMQGRFSSRINPSLITTLSDGRQQAALAQNYAANAITNGSWGINLAECLLPENEYTWQVCHTSNGVEGPWVDGPTVVTPEEDQIFIGRFGNYTAVGTPSWFTEPGTPNWSGAVAASSLPDQYSLSNFFNVNTDQGVTWANIGIDYVKDGNKLYLDNTNAIAGTSDGTMLVYAEGVIFRDGSPAAFAADGAVEIAWSDSARTFTFPTQIGGEDVAYTLAVFTNGEHDGYYADLYMNLVVTVSASGAPAFSGVRIDSRAMPLIGGVRKNSAVNSSTSVAVRRNMYVPYRYGSDLTALAR